MKRNRKKKSELLFTFLIGLLCLSVSLTNGWSQDLSPQEDLTQQMVHLSQSNKYLDKVIELDIQAISRAKALKIIAEKAGMKISYDSQLDGLDDLVSLNYDTISVQDALWKALDGTAIRFAVSKSGQLALFPYDKTPGKQDMVQTGSISGAVFDSQTDDPLPGANVFIKGTTKGTSTNEEGAYLLESVEIGTHTLVVTFVGYERQEREVTVRENEVTNAAFELDYLQTEFDEVVVIGYGSVNQRELTGSVSTIQSEELADLSPTIGIDQALQGKAAGVHVVQETGQPGSPARVRIRGSTSLLGSNQPLFVIDGIPVIAETNIPDVDPTFGQGVDDNLRDQGINSPLGNINPDDIESISILKDASAAAIYGSRAANGVVIITTKSGSRSGETQFNARYSLSTSEARTVDVLNAEQFKELYTEAVVNSGITTGLAAEVLDGSYFGDANTNWEDEVSRSNPTSTTFDISASGGNELLQYYTSVGIQDQSGTFDNSWFKRYSANLDLNTSLTENLKFGTKLNISASDQRSPDNALQQRIYEYRPDYPVFDENGEYTASQTYITENPVALSQAKNDNRTTLFLGSFFGELDIIDGLVFKSMLSINYNNGKLKSLYPSVTFRGGWDRNNGPGEGHALESNSTFFSHLWENTLTWRKTFMSDHNITALAGASWQGDRNEYLSASGEGFPKDNILTNLSSASEQFQIHSGATQSGLASYFSRVFYGYSDRYLLTLSGRMDGSTKFAVDNKWAFLPAIAGAWRISNEPFFSNVNFIDELKLRVSTGRTGQQDFSPYQWRTLFEASTWGGNSAVVQSRLGNRGLKWEVTQQLDVGLDFVIFDGHMSGTLGYYEKNTSDLLYFFTPPGNTGFNSVATNLGDTENRGFEVELEGDLIRTGDFTWNLSANITHNRNKLVKLNDDFLDEVTGTINPPNTGSRLRVGDPIGLIYGNIADGIFQDQSVIDELNANAPDGTYQDEDTAPGDIRFRDVNGDGEVTFDDRTIIGNVQPDFMGGFSSRWRYKGFSIRADFNYSIGNDLRWGTGAAATNFGSTFTSENKMEYALNRWTEENPSEKWPRAIYLDPNDNDRLSSFYVYDASYLRLKNLKVAYNLPESTMSGFLRHAQVYAIAQNLLTFTSYPGEDPETNNLFNDDVSSGLDNSRYPTPRVFTAGIRVGF